MEYNDGVEGSEFSTDGAKVETDDDGVDDDAKFEDEEGGDLLLEAAHELFWVVFVGPVQW